VIVAGLKEDGVVIEVNDAVATGVVVEADDAVATGARVVVEVDDAVAIGARVVVEVDDAVATGAQEREVALLLGNVVVFAVALSMFISTSL
jgi:hypothetical protein